LTSTASGLSFNKNLIFSVDGKNGNEEMTNDDDENTSNNLIKSKYFFNTN
jgi:hypothetical protein